MLLVIVVIVIVDNDVMEAVGGFRVEEAKTLQPSFIDHNDEV